MEPGSEKDSKYDVFRQDTSALEVAEEKLPDQPANTPPPTPKRNPERKRRIIGALLVAAVILALAASGISLIRSSSPQDTTVTINTQSLDNGTLNQLTADAGGTSKPQLTISPDTLFQNNVTVNKNLTVNGEANLQSAVNIDQGLTVGGNVGIGGNLSVTGQISAGILNVGTVTMDSLKLSGNLDFNGHLTPTGAVPAIRPSVAISGGSATIVGSDTAGTVTLVIGTNPAVTGEMAVITFRSAFTGTPKVQLTPTSNAAAKLDYFVTKSAGYFTIEASSIPVAGGTYSFDYFVTQ